MGRAVMGAAIEAVDPVEDQLLLDDVVYYRVGRSRGRMKTSFGSVVFDRNRFRRRKASSMFPAEARFGLLAGFWTPLAAEQGTLALSLLRMEDSRAVLRRLGGMEVSGNALNHLMTTSDAAWDVLRGALKEARDAEGVPRDAALLVVSLDGTMIGMRKEKAPPGQEDGARPAGYREASSGTISFYSVEGKCLQTVRYGRMPEAGKLSLKEDLLTEVAHYLELQPDLELVFIADRASSNWAWCEEVFPSTADLRLFPLNTAPQRRPRRRLRRRLVEGAAPFRETARDPEGRPEGPRQSAPLLAAAGPQTPAAGYHTPRDPLLPQAAQADAVCGVPGSRHWALPIGSGVVEAANKVLIAQRLKCSGMLWSATGTGQAILSFRALWKSGRFHAIWKQIMQSLEPEPCILRNRSGYKMLNLARS